MTDLNLENEVKEYHPELLSRRGEITSWILTLIAGSVLSLFYILSIPVPIWLPIIAILFLLSAILISLGNWIDRNTSISLTPSGIGFKDGLRNIFIKWEQIEHVETYSSSFGRKVAVSGNSRRFAFRLMGEVKLRGNSKGKLGFRDGEAILHTILRESHLVLNNSTRDVDYYTT